MVKDQKCENQETKAATRLVQGGREQPCRSVPGMRVLQGHQRGIRGPLEPGGGQQRVRWLDGITDSMDMSLS